MRLVEWYAGFFVAHNVWAWLNCCWSMNWLRKDVEVRCIPDAVFWVMLPMLREQNIAEATIDWFLKLEYPTELYRVCVVTSQAEIECEGNLESTYEIVRRVVMTLSASGVNRVRHLHVPGGNKAKQLNEAMLLLRRDLDVSDANRTFIAVYDADSRPDRRVLAEVDAQSFHHPHAAAFQQPAIYFRNYSILPRGLIGAYLRSRPLYNFRFCLFREIPAYHRSLRGLSNRRSLERVMLASPNHFLGHGEYIRLSHLTDPYPFPEPSADTSLGTLLSFKGCAIAPLRTFDVGETPASMLTLYLQGIVWFSGCSLFLRDFRAALRQGVSLRPWHFSMLFKRMLENAIWSLGPILYCVFITVCLFSERWIALALLGTAGFIHLLTILHLGLYYKEVAMKIHTDAALLGSLGWKELAKVIPIYPFMLLGSCLGPISYYILLIRKLLIGGDVPRYKTTRSDDASG